jgi:hypothetical protein
MEPVPLRGRPGTKPLPLTNKRAVGGPIALGLLATYVAIALAGWLATAGALVWAAPDLAAGNPLARAPVLATHLFGLGVLAFAVTGAAFHLVPVMLRNDVRHPTLLRIAPALLAGGFLLAPGIAFDRDTLVWTGATLVGAGLVLVLVELLGLVVHAPRGRTLVASRTGVALSCLHVAAAFLLGSVVFSREGEPFAGVGIDRWLLVHLNLAIIGWLTLLIVTVGRTLAPMLAQAPTPPERRLPVLELSLSAGLWTLLAGIAGSSRAATAVGGAVVLATLAAFGAFLARVARRRRGELEAPLGHLLAGILFLLQAAVFGFLLLAHAVSLGPGMTAYVVFLLLGWAGGVTLGHLGKLLALSLWVWWPPGPRPKQAELYPRTLWLAQAATFAVGVELLGLAPSAGSKGLAYAGTTILAASAVLACAGALSTWKSRWSG